MHDQYTKKPVTIQARQWDGTEGEAEEIVRWILEGNGTAALDYHGSTSTVPAPQAIMVGTLEGDMRANPQDWIIRGVKGEFYPCKPDVFEATYHLAIAEPSVAMLAFDGSLDAGDAIAKLVREHGGQASTGGDGMLQIRQKDGTTFTLEPGQIIGASDEPGVFWVQAELTDSRPLPAFDRARDVPPAAAPRPHAPVELRASDYPGVYEALGIDQGELGCVMATVPPFELTAKFPALVDDLYSSGVSSRWWVDGAVGERGAHFTVLYGLLHKAWQIQPQVEAVLDGWVPPLVGIDSFGVFESPFEDEPYDCVVAHLELSDQLLEGHDRLRMLPHVMTFPEYKPHVTLAYVRAGTGEYWARQFEDAIGDAVLVPDRQLDLGIRR